MTRPHWTSNLLYHKHIIPSPTRLCSEEAIGTRANTLPRIYQIAQIAREHDAWQRSMCHLSLYNPILLHLLPSPSARDSLSRNLCASMMKPVSLLFLLFFFFLTGLPPFVASKYACEMGSVIGKDARKVVAVTEYGQITAVDINDRSTRGGRYHLQFFTLEPNSLFLPVLLHADMVFYVHTGSGSFSWLYEEKMNKMNVRRGDVYRIHSGSVFYFQSSLESTREKLRVYTIFTTPPDESPKEMFSTVYSSIADMVLGFDTEVLEAAFLIGKEVAEEIKRAVKPPPIVHAPPNNRTDEMNWTGRIIKALVEDELFELNGKKSKQKKSKAFNILDRTPDVKNCNGWSTAVDSKKFKELQGSEVGVFMVNLTQGSMMGPHWNPRAGEIAIVTNGPGMIQVISPICKNRRFVVYEGDVIYVPRFHPMVQMAFNNGTFVFVGFSTMETENYPQFLAGKNSVIRTLDKDILAISLNVSNKTIDQLVSSQVDSTILGCLSCAEEEERIMWEETKRQREEEEKKEEEEAKEREKQEEKRKKEEEEARKKEEEQRKKEEEEARRKQQEEEEARQREKEEEEEARQREAEKARQREKEEEEARKKEEEQRKKEEEEARRKQQEEEEARQREKEEEEEARQREEEKARQREKEKEEAVRQREKEEQEEARQREKEEEEARQREREEEEEARQREKEEEEAARQREQEQEEARGREKEAEEPRGGGKRVIV